jgi:spore maturation protein SpmB
MDFVDGAEEGVFVAVEIVWEVVQQLLVALHRSGSSVKI